MGAALCAIFFLSGAAALVFETLWFHQAALAFGSSVWATSLVVAAFMGGLALGNALAARLGHRLARPLRAYALLELAIGASGTALVPALPWLTPLLARVLGPFAESPAILNPLRLVTAFGLLLAPATAMGATLPLVVASLLRADPRFGRALGRLYGWNTLGAVVGALAGEVVLFEAFGIRGTALVACAANAAAAAGALALSRREGEAAGRLPARCPRSRAAVAPDARKALLIRALAAARDLDLARDDEAAEGAHERGVELRARAALDLAGRLLEAARWLVAGEARHRVEGVGERDDARLERDRVAGEALGIARAVPPLVVVVDGRSDLRPDADAVEHAEAEHRVLGAGARVHLLGAVELQHPDVVEQRREVQPLEPVLLEGELAPETVRVLRDAVRVAAVVVEVRVERVDEDVGHVREEVALPVLQVGVVQRHRSEPGEGRGGGARGLDEGLGP